MDTNPQPAGANAALASENERLRVRIKELESESPREPETGSSRRRSSTGRTRKLSPETKDRISDIPNHATDEMEKLARAVSYATAEHIRSTSDVLNSFADEVFKRGARRDSEGDTTLTDDVMAGVASAFHESLDTPRRVIERFFDAYQEENKPRSSPRSRTPDEPARGGRVEIKEKTVRTESR